MSRLLILCQLCALIAFLEAFREGFRFASYYGDHMVLQQAPERAVIWGYGDTGSTVAVIVSEVLGSRAQVAHVQNGIWKVSLDPVKAGGPYNVTAWQKGNSTLQIVLKDVLFGDVWLCGGQSNMAFTVSQLINASDELALATKYPQVRIFTAALEQSTEELRDLARVEVPWAIPTAELLGGRDFTHFSAVCWLFGRYLYQTLGYPVGLVESCWGGTSVEAWSSRRALQKCNLGGGADRFAEKRDNVPTVKSLVKNSVLWNAMIHPLLNMTIKGAIWYQGEENTNYHQDQYNCSFPAMIDDWRMAFHEGSEGQTAVDFPFGFVQISTNQKHSEWDGYPNLRWHQTADYGFAPNPRMKRTFMAVALDLPDESSPSGSIHPRYKQDVAFRLTLGARAVAYGEKGISFQGPFPDTILLLKDGNINITYNQPIFFNASLNETLYEICCSDQVERCWSHSSWLLAPIMHWGRNYVQLCTDACADMVSAVRYAWRDWPCDLKSCLVYSTDRVLPAPPFISNRWPQRDWWEDGVKWRLGHTEKL